MAGCEWDIVKMKGSAEYVPVPAPMEVMLPKTVRIHPFTGARSFGEGGMTGMDVRIEVLDAWGDSTKAFGKFRFELYDWVNTNREHKGERLAVWNRDVEDPQVNRGHWDAIQKTYNFKLGLRNPINIGHEFVLSAYFESNYGPRLFAEKVFISGE